jgi:hypothetical protein
MLNISTAIVNILTSDPTLTSIIKPSNISVGRFDVTVETQVSLTMPQISIQPISESVRTVPLNAKDTNIQIDIWSRNSELEAQTIYERVIYLLNFQTYTQGSSWVAWQRLSNVSSSYESDGPLWHYYADFQFWSVS